MDEVNPILCGCLQKRSPTLGMQKSAARHGATGFAAPHPLLLAARGAYRVPLERPSSIARPDFAGALLPNDCRIGKRTNLGYLRGGQDDQHREGDRGCGREDGTDLEILSRTQVGCHQNPEHLRGGTYGGTNDLHVLTPWHIVVFGARTPGAATRAPPDCSRDTRMDDFAAAPQGPTPYASIILGHVHALVARARIEVGRAVGAARAIQLVRTRPTEHFDILHSRCRTITRSCYT
jgi:hypothetical protein